MNRRECLFVLLAAMACAVPRAGYADERPVALDVEPCVSVEPARLAELLTLELRVLTDAGGRSAQPPVAARITCAGDAVVLSVSDVSGAPAAERRLDWAAYSPESRPRLLALALSDMIARRWKEASVPPPPPPPPPSAPPIVDARPLPAAPASPPAALRSWDVGLLASVERIGRPQLTSVGADLAMRWQVRPWMTARTSARAATASFDSTPGTVSARTISWMFAGLFGVTRGRLSAGAGPGVRAGWAWLRGEPNGIAPAGRTFDAGWWGPLLAGETSVRATRQMTLVLTVEAGFVARPVVGDVGPPPPAGPTETVAWDGPWLTVSAGGAWRF